MLILYRDALPSFDDYYLADTEKKLWKGLTESFHNEWEEWEHNRLQTEFPSDEYDRVDIKTLDSDELELLVNLNNFDYLELMNQKSRKQLVS